MSSTAMSWGGAQMNPTGANGTGGATPPWVSGPDQRTAGFGGPTDHTAFGTPQRSVDPWGGGGSGPMAPPTGSPGNYGYGASANPNPNPPSLNPGGTTAPPIVSTNHPLSTQFGATGDALQSFLASNGGYNSALTQQAVEAQLKEMQLQANQNFGNIESGLGAAGINPNSSAAALESSNFWSQTTAAENAMTAEEYYNMWNSSMNREAGLLGSMAGPAAAYQENYYNQNNTSTFDWLGLFLGGAQQAAAGYAAGGAGAGG